MNDLLELAGILSKESDYRPEVFRARPGWTPDMDRLFDGIASHRFETDASAMAGLEFTHPTGKNRYFLLKSRLRRRLLNSLHLLSIKSPRYSEQSQAFYRVHKHLFWCHVLERFSTGALMIELAEKGLQLAEKYEMTLAVIQFAAILRRSAAFRGMSARFKLFDKKLQQANELHIAETRISSIYQKLAIEFAKTASDKPELRQTAIDAAQEARALATTFTSYDVRIYAYRIRVIASQIARDYHQAMLLCDEAIAFLRLKPHYALPVRMGEFTLQKLLAHLHLREYEQGKATAEECEKLFRHGSLSWFIFREYYFLLALHTERFDEAKQLYDSTTQNSGFVILPEEKKERWRIYEAFLQYVLKYTQSPLYKYTRRESEDIDRLLRTVPTYLRDKKGYNVSLLILQILYLLQRKDFGEITLRMDALKSYRSRYLRGNNRQSTIFFRLLLMMERYSFDYEKTEKYGGQGYHRLKRTSPNYFEYEEALSILPYDWLWPHMLKSLKRGQAKAEIWRAQSPKPEETARLEQ